MVFIETGIRAIQLDPPTEFHPAHTPNTTNQHTGKLCSRQYPESECYIEPESELEPRKRFDFNPFLLSIIIFKF